MKRGVIIAIYAASILSHVGVGVAVASIERRLPGAPERIEVELAALPPEPPPVEEPPPAEEPPPVEEAPPPPPKRVEAPKPTPKPAAEPPPKAAAEPPPVFGVAMGNSDGPGGIAVPVGDPGGVKPGAARPPREARRLAPTEAPKKAAAAVCPGETRKPKALSMPHPQYTSAAREAGVAGRVRVEITVGPNGEVESARVISALGHGLDEAALEAARGARFEAALDCGRAISATFVVSIRFRK